MNILENLIEAEKLAGVWSDKIRRAFWPLLTNEQKRTYWYVKHNWIICGDVDRMMKEFSKHL